MKSHQQRKHSVIEEKHELSDDNEKGDVKPDGVRIPEDGISLNQSISTVHIEKGVSDQDISQSNNNNEHETGTNCDACSQKKKMNSSSIAIQCDVAIIGSKEVPTMQTKISEKIDGKWEFFLYFSMWQKIKPISKNFRNRT